MIEHIWAMEPKFKHCSVILLLTVLKTDLQVKDTLHPGNLAELLKRLESGNGFTL